MEFVKNNFRIICFSSFTEIRGLYKTAEAIFHPSRFWTFAIEISWMWFYIQTTHPRIMLNPYFQLIARKIADFKGKCLLFQSLCTHTVSYKNLLSWKFAIFRAMSWKYGIIIKIGDPWIKRIHLFYADRYWFHRGLHKRMLNMH